MLTAAEILSHPVSHHLFLMKVNGIIEIFMLNENCQSELK